MRRASSAESIVIQVQTKSVPHEVLTFGDARVDFTSMEAQRAGKTVILTTQEFNLLRYMAASAERVVSRHELLNDVWGYENYPSTRTVDNYILRLRQKFEPDPSTPLFFITVHGAGYKFIPGGATAGSNS